MALPSNFPNKDKSYRIVVGGDKNDPDQNKLSLCKVFEPARHLYPSILPEQLPQIATERAADHLTQTQFNPPPEQGTVVVCEAARGSPSSVVITGMPTDMNNQQNVGGNSGLYDLMRIVSQISTGKRIKPQIVEKMVNGVLVREMQEKGQDWKHDHTRGLATHAAWHSMVGQKVNEVKNIDTAIQSFANIPNAAALGQLPGSILNLASVFQGLTKAQKKRATKHMDENLATGLENMMLLMGDVTSASTQYVASDRIHPEVFTENMIELLSQVQNVGDLVDLMHRLNTDETLRGMEEYLTKADTGLTATLEETITLSDEVAETSNLILSATITNSRVHFDEGYSLNIANKTYLVTTADINSDVITIYPKVTGTLEDVTVFVYEPFHEYEYEGPYGTQTMQMDMNGNIKPKKSSLQSLQSAMQSLTGLLNSAESGGGNLFGDATNQMSQLFNRIPKNIRPTVLNEVAQTAKTKLDSICTKCKGAQYPF